MMMIMMELEAVRGELNFQVASEFELFEADRRDGFKLISASAPQAPASSCPAGSSLFCFRPPTSPPLPQSGPLRTQHRDGERTIIAIDSICW